MLPLFFIPAIPDNISITSKSIRPQASVRLGLHSWETDQGFLHCQFYSALEAMRVHRLYPVFLETGKAVSESVERKKARSLDKLGLDTFKLQRQSASSSSSSSSTKSPTTHHCMHIHLHSSFNPSPILSNIPT